MSTITISVDLAKHVFSVCEMDGARHVLRRQDLRREPFGRWLAQLPAGTIVAMEGCSGAHYWARRCVAYGLQPRIIAAQFVTPFRKGRRTNNDRADAEAIATVGNAREFKHSRQMAAWLGLVPTQHSSGAGHARLGQISCRDDPNSRTRLSQLVHSSLQRAKAVDPD